MRARDAWIAAFLIAVFTPPVLRLFATEHQSIGRELVTVTGLLASSLLVCAVVLPSRLRSLTRAFGIESTLLNHRVLGLSTALMVLAHISAVVVADPRGVALLVPFLNPNQPADTVAATPLLMPLLTPPARAMAGSVATACLVGLAVLANRRQGRYEIWRAWHLALTGGTLLASAVHVLLIGHLFPTNALVGLALGDPLGYPVLRATLSDPAGALFLLVLVLVVLGVALRRWLLRPMSRRSRYRVAAVRALSPTVSTITLRPLGRAAGTRYRPGQFAWLRLTPDPFGEEHPFTVSSAEQDHPMVEFTIRHSGDWTRQLRRLGSGDSVWLDGPHGSFTPDPLAQGGMVLIAGGVGIAPMMAILRTAARDDQQREIALLLTDRPSADLLFRDELTRLQSTLDLHISELAGAQLTGPLFADVLPARFKRSRLDYYVCGPPGLVSDAVAALGALAVPRHRIHTEQFDI